MADFERLDDNSLKGALEALLLVSSEAVSAIDLAKTLGVAPGDAAAALADLAAEYADANRGIQLREVAGGWRFFTHPAYHDQVEKYVLSWDKTRLSQAALETGVRAVRGVNSDGVISSLVEKGLVREAGRDKDRGGAILYGTTRSFLERFGLKSLRELPNLEDFAPDEESKQFIRERLSGTAITSTLEETDEDLEDERELLGDDYDEDATDSAAPADAESDDEPAAETDPEDATEHE